MGDDFNRDIDHTIHNLEYFFNVVNVSDCFFELLEYNCLFNNTFNLTYCFIFITNFNYFFILANNFLHFLHDDWHFNDLLHDVLDVSVDINQLRNNLFDLYNSRYFYNFLFKTLHLIDLGYNN